MKRKDVVGLHEIGRQGFAVTVREGRREGGREGGVELGREEGRVGGEE